MAISLAQWAGTKPLPSHCRFLANRDQIQCCKRRVCRSYYRPPPRAALSRERPITSHLPPMPNLLPALVETGSSLLTGRASTTAPTADNSAVNGGSLSRVGSLLPGAWGTVGNVLGTIGDSILTGRSGRANQSVEAPTTVGRAGVRSNFTPIVVGSAGAVARVGAAMWPRVAPWIARAAKLLVKTAGVVTAAEVLGLTTDHVAHLAVKPRRRRGITAASMRTTRRTIRQVCSLHSQLRAIVGSAGSRARRCRRK